MIKKFYTDKSSAHYVSYTRKYNLPSFWRAVRAFFVKAPSFEAREAQP